MSIQHANRESRLKFTDLDARLAANTDFLNDRSTPTNETVTPPAAPGDRLIVRLDEGQHAMYKQDMDEGGQRYLNALNPARVPLYFSTDGDATIHSKVIVK